MHSLFRCRLKAFSKVNLVISPCSVRLLPLYNVEPYTKSRYDITVDFVSAEELFLSWACLGFFFNFLFYNNYNLKVLQILLPT